MPLYKKSMLAANKTYQSPDGELKVTRKRLKHWATQSAAMIAAGLEAPCGWDHSDDPDKCLPVKFSVGADGKRSSKDSLGALAGMNLSPDGKSAELVLDIRDPEAARKVKNNVIEISPIICEEMTDGDGRVWKDFISHVDFVQYPVDHNQKPFVPVVEGKRIAASLRMGLTPGKSKVYRMAAEDTHPKKEEEESTEDEGGEGGKPKCLDDVKGLLKEFSIVLPEDTTEENALERLHTALLTAKAHKDAADEEEDDDDDDSDETKPTEASPAFAAMGLRTDAAYSFAQKQYRMGIGQRLESLVNSGRCTPAELKEHSGKAKVIKLSLNTKTGDPIKSETERWIESRESIPAGACWNPEQQLKRMGAVQEAKAPSVLMGGEDITEEEADAIVDEMFGKKKTKARS